MSRRSTRRIDVSRDGRWIPPIPQQVTNPLRFRLITLLCAVLASGPLALSFQSVYHCVAHDNGLLSLLIGLLGTIAVVALIAILASQLPVAFVTSIAVLSLFFSIQAVIWFIELIIHEQARQENPFAKSAGVITPYDITPDVFLSTVEIAISIGLFIGLIVAIRRNS